MRVGEHPAAEPGYGEHRSSLTCQSLCDFMPPSKLYCYASPMVYLIRRGAMSGVGNGAMLLDDLPIQLCYDKSQNSLVRRRVPIQMEL